MKLYKLLFLYLFCAFSLFFITNANAQLGKFGKALSSSKEKDQGVDVDTLLNNQKGLMGRFNSALNNMLAAQANTLDALGLKEDAALAKNTADFFGAGAVDDKDQIERGIEVTLNSQEKIDKELEKEQALSDEAKPFMAAAAAHYGRGMYDAIKLPPDFRSWSESVTSTISNASGNPMQAGKVLQLKNNAGPALYVAQNLPTLITVWGDSTKNFAKFAKKNDVDVSDLDQVIGDL